MPEKLTIEVGTDEVVVSSARGANLVREHRALTVALDSLNELVDTARRATEDVEAAQRQVADYDAIPRTVLVDDSFADELVPCCVCREPVPWDNALLLPCSSVEDGEVESVGLAHRVCPDAALTQGGEGG